ncbi:MAG: hypothetical protein A2086_08585 [Spirochaetes bacterium GWD1_27_9]|nr:MAG: hypothetical protein A2Z98_15525 [Spirochaetes bacterium GWB1_27_13]OHD21689.1 MAG: hypothetical protein A2Y34_14060 [Spirochaetes bacterium GWC1_27_15]OHD44441.1 MAG: hypothetical protein A2086_08585 [Spirochaetes bacterium GWD1_27_9]
MIGIKIGGGLGNQMFQYAFGYVVAKKFSTSFYLEKRNQFKLDKYFSLRILENSINSLIKPLYKMQTKLGKIKMYDWEDFGTKTPESFISQIKDNIYYCGYFQSEKYFEGFYKDLQKIFKIKKEYIEQFNSKYEKFYKENKVIAIHIRRGDYINFGDDSLGGKNMTLPISYYTNCLKQIKDISSYKIIFISDDIEFVKKEFGQKENYFFESNNEIIDFQVILNADKVIMSNSSFSWWASYLNIKATDIYCPNYWLGFKIGTENPIGIVCKKWTRLDI